MNKLGTREPLQLQPFKPTELEEVVEMCESTRRGGGKVAARSTTTAIGVPTPCTRQGEEGGQRGESSEQRHKFHFSALEKEGQITGASNI